MTSLFALWSIQVRLQNSCEGAVPLREWRTPRWWGDGCARTQRCHHCFGGPDEGEIDVARWKRRWHFHHQEEKKKSLQKHIIHFLWCNFSAIHSSKEFWGCASSFLWRIIVAIHSRTRRWIQTLSETDGELIM